jgi:hypothetical protein
VDVTARLDSGSGQGQLGADGLLAVLEPHGLTLGKPHDLGHRGGLGNFDQLDPLLTGTVDVHLHQGLSFRVRSCSWGDG